MKKSYLFFSDDPDPKPDKKPERRDLDESVWEGSDRPPQRPVPPTETKPDKGSIKKTADPN